MPGRLGGSQKENGRKIKSHVAEHRLIEIRLILVIRAAWEQA